MRADRLLSLLMLLQTRGRMTARALSETLEVSERTVYRDIEALAASGVPVYTECGPGGGCSLLDSYRTNLTGLNEDEVRALFMLSIPAPLARLGVGQELKAAMLKLSASLPASRRSDEERVRGRIHLDSSWWFQSEEPVPHLQTLHHAVWQDRRLRLTYLYLFEPRGELVMEHIVEPYGLVAKASVWYLVASRAGRVQAYRVTQVLDARLCDERFERPAGFDLASFWQQWCAEYERSQAYFPVTVRVAPDLARELWRHFGDYLRAEVARAKPDSEGWITLTLPFERLEAARSRLLAFGGAVEVLAPEALRLSIADFAAQAVARYSSTRASMD